MVSRLPRASGRFDGLSALVTGAASGIGAATAQRLADEGARVTLMDLSDTVHEVAERLSGDRARAIAVTADVTDEAGWAGALELTRATGGGLDILVSNACANRKVPLHELDRAAWDQLIDVNLTGTYLGIRACLPDLLERRGTIVVTSSVHALFGLPANPAYAAAKGGLTALTRQLAAEYGSRIRVNAVLPGPILTPAWDGTSEAERAMTIEQTVLGRFGAPEEVAAAIAFLASPDASYVTGASLLVDGGWSVFKTSL